MTKRIIIMAGGTGGHVFPALAVAQALAEKDWQVSWLGTQKGLESRVIPENGIAIDWLSVAGVRGKGLLSKVMAILMLLKACLQAAVILRKRKPDVVLGMGGFVAGPGGLMAKILGIPLVIHEQNRVPGTTNRLLARIANRVLEAFPDSFEKNAGAECTGNPLRKPFLQLQDKPGKAEIEPLNILIVGGSQGAKALNESVPDAIAEIGRIKVKHQTGLAMRDQVAERYTALGVDAEVSDFISDMVAAYQWADLIICRAGAMTISEVAAVGVPGIFIPLPGAIDDHQTANAKYLTDAGAGRLLMQKDLNKATLVLAIKEVREKLDVMRQAAKQSARLDATEVVAGYCIAEAKV
ncbi:MAG: undecaprenyldiphospho-muramoylpentapeptide beta-N-acetylglucosaminyltransferase [Methylococcaceae bacterium]|nr:undecaprenyldiphospho-muramoylpentapeptide beta-N-acetylglucosaminyltransferase [Methylococcaceae bacterium]